MGIQLVTGSSQYLIARVPPPFTSFPMSFGCWVFPFTAAGGPAVCFGDNTQPQTSRSRVEFTMGSSNVTMTVSTAGTGSSASPLYGGLLQWSYIFCRHSSATVGRCDTLAFDGTLNSAARAATSTSPVLNEYRLGTQVQSGTTSLSFADGCVAEFWYAGTDLNEITPNSAAIPSNLMFQLAYGGPFSIDELAQEVVEHWSFRNGPRRNVYTEQEDYHIGRQNGQTFTEVSASGPIMTSYIPPVPYWMTRPNQRKIILPY